MKAGDKETTFWEALRQFPPYYIRMLAKNGRATALSDSEIAIASGIEINRVRQIKCLTTWDDVTVGEMLRFTTACNFDPTHAPAGAARTSGKTGPAVQVSVSRS